MSTSLENVWKDSSSLFLDNWRFIHFVTGQCTNYMHSATGLFWQTEHISASQEHTEGPRNSFWITGNLLNFSHSATRFLDRCGAYLPGHMHHMEDRKIYFGGNCVKEQLLCRQTWFKRPRLLRTARPVDSSCWLALSLKLLEGRGGGWRREK